jgi:hypothetical protein
MTKAAPRAVGVARCPLCGGDAMVTENKNGHAVLTHRTHNCHTQIQTRCAESDAQLRKWLKAPMAAPGAISAPTVPIDPPKPVQAMPEPVPRPKNRFFLGF